MPIKKFLPGNTTATTATTPTTATTATTPTTATTATTTTNVTDCYDVHQQNKLLPGVYSIQVDTQTTVNVSCLASGWTVFQSRGQPTTSLKDGPTTKMDLELEVRYYIVQGLLHK